MKREASFESGHAHVHPEDLERNIDAFYPMVDGRISDEEWRDILVSEGVVTDRILMTDLHDHLLDHGDNIKNVDELRAAIQKLKELTA